MVSPDCVVLLGCVERLVPFIWHVSVQQPAHQTQLDVFFFSVVHTASNTSERISEEQCFARLCWLVSFSQSLTISCVATWFPFPVGNVIYDWEATRVLFWKYWAFSMLFMCLASLSDSIYRVKIYAAPDMFRLQKCAAGIIICVEWMRSVLIECESCWLFFPSQQAATKKTPLQSVFRPKSIWTLMVILPLLLGHNGFEMKQSRCDLGVFSYTWSVRIYRINPCISFLHDCHQMRSVLLWDALSGHYCSCLQYLKHMICWEIGWLIRPLKNIQFLCLQ